MSHHITDLVWPMRTGSPALKLVLLAVADHQNSKTNEAFPSIQTICQRTELSRRSVIRSLDKLCGLGLIIETGSRAGRTKQIKSYRICDGGAIQTELIKGATAEPLNSATVPIKGATVAPVECSPNISTEQVLNTEAESVYKEYPMKVGKPAALISIKKAIKKFGLPLILSKTRQYARVRKEHPEFLPNPSTWFNQERFNDDPSTWLRKNTNVRTSLNPNNF